jgi:hypothetical protein
MNITHLIELKESIERLDKIITVAQVKRNIYKEQLTKECTHPTTKRTAKYDSGGYDYVSTITITDACTICGFETSFKDPTHKGSYA